MPKDCQKAGRGGRDEKKAANGHNEPGRRRNKRIRCESTAEADGNIDFCGYKSSSVLEPCSHQSAKCGKHALKGTE